MNIDTYIVMVWLSKYGQWWIAARFANDLLQSERIPDGLLAEPNHIKHRIVQAVWNGVMYP